MYHNICGIIFIYRITIGLLIILDSFLDSLEIKLGSFWNCFRIVLGSTWIHLGIIYNSYWIHFGIVLGSGLGSTLFILGSFKIHF